MGFTADLAARALSLSLERVPEAALAVARTALADTLAVALAARDERVVGTALAVAAPHTVGAVGAVGAAGTAGIVGTALRTDPARAAFVNATAAHALDFDDVCWAMNAHASAVLWPAALAVAEATGADGSAALLGYVAGFEAAADVGAVLGEAHYAAGFHPTATIGVLGATVTAGKILGLDALHLRRAIGIACSRAAGSRMNFGTDTKPLHAGFAAEAGVTAALLAMHGATAAEDGVEAAMGLAALYGGRVPGADEARRGFALLDPGVEVKPYPSCRFTHRVIDATLALRERRRDVPVTEIECRVDPFARRIVVYDAPKDGQQAKFSMQYTAAITWLEGWPGLAEFADARVRGEDVTACVRRVKVESGSRELEEVVVHYADGTTDSERVPLGAGRGSPGRPLAPDEFERKVATCLHGVRPGDSARPLILASSGIDSASGVGMEALVPLFTGVHTPSPRAGMPGIR